MQDELLLENHIELMEKLDEILLYTQSTAGALVEISWCIRFFLIIYIIFKAWGVVRK